MTKPGVDPQQMPRDEAKIAQIVADIEAKKYQRRPAGWHFRTGLGLRDYLARAIVLMMLLVIALFTKPGTPRGREDKEWLVNFSIVMLIWFTCVHTIAYLPGRMFGGFRELVEALNGRISHMYNNYRDWQYLVLILVLIVVLYPFILYFYILYDGFNPYDELTAQEMRVEGGLKARICYVMRITLHFFMLIMTIYLIAMLLFKYFIRNSQRTPGGNNWWARTISRLPYGPLFYQPGEFFDCGICLGGIWRSESVVRLSCSLSSNDNNCCVFHSECLR